MRADEGTKTTGDEAAYQTVRAGRYRALNCALLTWKTNRIIGRKDPLEYLKDRVEWADEKTVRRRLDTHLVPFDHLAKASYGNLQGDALKAKLQPEFEAFLLARAKLIEEAAKQLSNGDNISVGSVTKEKSKGTD